jgi:hypothetical protein
MVTHRWWGTNLQEVMQKRLFPRKSSHPVRLAHPSVFTFAGGEGLIWRFSVDPARQETKPPSHARMVLDRFCKECVLAGFAAEAQAPMVVRDKTELSATV